MFRGSAVFVESLWIVVENGSCIGITFISYSFIEGLTGSIETR
jgi:hypothetical protein